MKELVQTGDRAYWSFLVEYIPGSSGNGEKTGNRSSIDYRDVLSAEDFSIFLKLKELRSILAEKDGVPVYAVFNNRQLAEIVQDRPDTLLALQKIKGVGESRVKSYGQAVLDLLNTNAVSKPPDTESEPSPGQDEAVR